jgi:GTP cyclohydrolase I
MSTLDTKSTSVFPDVAISSKPKFIGKLSKVGMEQVEIPVKIINNEGTMSVPALANLYVSLDQAETKGIHMSRLFLIAQEKLEGEAISHELLKSIVKELKASHKGLSEEAFFEVSFEYMLRRPALISDNKGWRFYPATYKAFIDKNDQIKLQLELKLSYSSTCPCSAALARQLIKGEFERKFANKKDSKIDFAELANWLSSAESQVATPHSQRSYAYVNLEFTECEDRLMLKNLIDELEQVIATPVQAAVKREDEQEFARLNGSNFMFAEDAARRVKTFCDTLDCLTDYNIKVEHVESLHPHNAVAYATKSKA